MDEQGWEDWARATLRLLGLETDGLEGHGWLQCAMSYRIGLLMGDSVANGRDVLARLREAARDGVASGGEGVARDGGDDASGAGAAAEHADEVGKSDESDGDPKL
jgi:hypothetical protein